MNSKLILMLSASAFAPHFASAQNDEHTHSDDEIIVTGTPFAHPEHESIIAASVLTADDLASRGEASLGELLRREPGVSSTFFGPAASRPVIRGLSGDRVSVLDAGIGSIDASSVSDDHAVAVEPATASRIEIIRGAATLYYGSSAAGGVVNVFDGRIPDELPEDGIDGALRTSLGAVDDSVEAAGGFDLHAASLGNVELVLHGDGFYRNTDDYEVPGFAESFLMRAAEEPAEHAEEDEAFGIVENSALATKGGAFGGSLIFERGFFGVSARLLRSDYGVPGGHHEGEEEEGASEESVRINLEQERLDFMGEVDSANFFIKKAKFRFGLADYIHREIEGGEIGTVFKNKGYEGRLELIEQDRGQFRGANGFQFKHRDFSAAGDEAFTPANVTNQFGIFTVREYETEFFHAQLAGRYEHTSVEAATIKSGRKFDAVSLSAGIGVEPNESLFLGVNALRTERAPAPEELFSNGPHLATNAYERGDASLGLETALGVEATLHGELERVTVTINGFYTDYKNFISLIPNGAEEEGLPVFNFTAKDAVFKGFEALAEADLLTVGPFEISGSAQADYVHAVFKNNDGFVPRIPPLRALLGLEAQSSHIDLRGELEIAAAQNNTTSVELPTMGYEMYNFSAVWRPGGEDHGLSIQFRADNLTNEEARLHTSFLKDIAPLPGRNFKITFRGAF